MSDNTLIRSLHDLGIASWFGGSLMGALGVNGASRDITDPAERARVAASGWARWSPVAAASVGAHLVGGLGLVVANRDRVAKQSGVGANTAVKAALTVAAMASTAYSGVLGARLGKEPEQPSGGGANDRGTAIAVDASGNVPDSRTGAKATLIQQQLRVLQWVTPVLTGAVIVLGAQQGEQQRPDQMIAGRARAVLGGLRDKVA